MNNKPKVTDKVVFREEEDEAFLFDPDTGDIKTLNPVGIFIWKSCDGSYTKGDIVNKITENFDTESRDVVEKDLNSFLKELTQLGFIINT